VYPKNGESPSGGVAEDIVWRSEILTEIPKWIRTWLWDMN
jgi:hypothetical protein